MKKFIFLFFGFIMLFATEYYEGDRNFIIVNPQNTRNIYGDYILGGNTAECVTDNKVRFSGAQCTNNMNHNDNNYIVKYIDVDNKPYTWNSSVSTIILPNDVQKVVWAGLFWQGNLNNVYTCLHYSGFCSVQKRAVYIDPSDFKKGYRLLPRWNHSFSLHVNNSDANNVLIKFNNNDYSRIYADTVNYDKYYGAYGFVYSAYKNITNLFHREIPNVQRTKEINVTVANISANEGREVDLGDFSGWAIAIIYKSTNSNLFKRVVIYNGYKIISPSIYSPYVSKTILINNLMLPSLNSVDSKFSAFVGEGDYRYYPDHMKIDNHIVHGDYGNDNNIFDSRMSTNIIRPNIGNNDKINTDGIDVDEYNVTNILTQIRNDNPDTTSIHIKVDSKEDAYFVSMIAFSVKLYVPQFCYDYAYSQNGIYFTEPYNPETSPRIIGNVIPNDDINASIYIRNNDNNDIIAKNLKFNIIDLNQSQMNFNSRSVYLYDSETNTYTHISKDEFNIATDGNETNITDISEGNITKISNKYLYFTLKPSVDEINQSMQNWEIKYSLYKIINGEEINIPQTRRLRDIPICAPKFEYTPAWNQFNIVDKKLYNNGNSKYNLFTQVAGRAHPYKAVSYNKNNLNQPKNYNYSVSVDMINVGGFHDINATCQNPYALKYPINSLTQFYLPVNFNGNSNINLNITPIAAIRDAALRINFIDWITLFNKRNFTCNNKINYNGMPKCISNNENNYKTIFGNNSPCLDNCFGNNKNSNKCLICTLKYYGDKVCSRDNFSIRPDGFNVVLKDPIKNSLIANDINEIEINLSAGIDYKLDINATSYNSLNAVNGYTGFFGNFADKNISLIWNSNKNSNVCADTSNKIIKKYILNGKINTEFNNTNVGEYNLSIIDKDWTKVDWDSNYLGHHNNSNFYSGADCNINSSITQHANSDVNISGNSVEISSLNGCEITNKNHFSPGINKTFKDMNLSFMPYKFKLIMNDSYGIVNETNHTGWLYNTDIIHYPNDENNSYKIIGQIMAVNKIGTKTTNFTNGCFAKDVNITLNSTPSNSLFPMQYVVYDNNNAKETNETNKTFVLVYKEGNFTKANQGLANIKMLMNYKKEFNQTRSPVEVYFSDINVTSNMNYELNGTKFVNGNKTLDKNLTFRYGRIDVQNLAGYGNELNTTYQYEYWTENGWIVNKEHNSSIFGDVNETLSYHPFVTMDVNHTIKSGKENISLSTTHAIPYSTKVHLAIPSWLWYNPLAESYKNPSATNQNCLTHPCESVTFNKISSGWGGIGKDNVKSSETNRTAEINASLKKVKANKSEVKKLNW